MKSRLPQGWPLASPSRRQGLGTSRCRTPTPAPTSTRGRNPQTTRTKPGTPLLLASGTSPFSGCTARPNPPSTKRGSSATLQFHPQSNTSDDAPIRDRARRIPPSSTSCPTEAGCSELFRESESGWCSNTCETAALPIAEFPFIPHEKGLLPVNSCVTFHVSLGSFQTCGPLGKGRVGL